MHKNEFLFNILISNTCNNITVRNTRDTIYNKIAAKTIGDLC